MQNGMQSKSNPANGTKMKNTKGKPSSSASGSGSSPDPLVSSSSSSSSGKSILYRKNRFSKKSEHKLVIHWFKNS